MFNEEIPSWRNAISSAHDGILRSRLHFIGVHRKPTITIQKLEHAQMNAVEIESKPEEEKLSTSKSPTVQASKTSINTCVTAEGTTQAAQSNSEVTVDMPEESEPITVIEAPCRSNSQTKKPRIVITDENSQWETFDPSVCDSSYQWLHRETKKGGAPARKCVSDSSNSGLFTELSDEDASKTESAKSVRCGYHSVSTLRSRLEAKMRGMTSRRTLKPSQKRSNDLPQVKEAKNDKQEAPSSALPLIEELPAKARKSNATTTTSSLERTRRAGRSLSETECASRRQVEKPTVTSYDDSLLDVPLPEHISSSKRQTQDWRNTSTSLEKYNPNQWWAQPLRV
ncbi:hypothetical protein Y032_0090g2391 [Ancylostoma ceylanicum]|nr:hypothetical protein Y032_0090g2391 [Ancylostoma ceylanicum]